MAAAPIRADGRETAGKLRPLSAELSCLSRADGSARLTCGSTQVLAAVYGPATPRSRERSGEAIIAAVFKRGISESAPSWAASEREIERFLVDTLTSCVCVKDYPRGAIEIVVQVIRADGSMAGTALNAAVMALMDAGVQMHSLPTATTCLLPTLAGADGPWLDPCRAEEESPDTTGIIIVTDSIRGGVLASITFGVFQFDSFLACVEGASRASTAVVAFMRTAIEQKVTREAQTLWST